MLKGSTRPQRGFFIMASVALSNLPVTGRSVTFWNILIKTESKTRKAQIHIMCIEGMNVNLDLFLLVLLFIEFDPYFSHIMRQIKLETTSLQ